MATFVQIEPDAFNANANKLSKGLGLQHSADGDEANYVRSVLYHHVRRPVRGIQIKNDTYAIIQVRTSSGVNIPLFDAANSSNSGKGPLNSNFLIQSVTERRAEKQQIILTFGEPYIFLFGEQPRIIDISGVLLNTEDFNWRAEWWANYDQYLRGTQCVRTRSRVYLSWDDIVVEGYITQAGANDEASNNSLVQFQFQMFVTNYQNISSIGDINAHWAGKDIHLDPNSVDLPGTTDSASNISLVRQQNVENLQLASGQGSNSLIDYLRDGSNPVSSRVAELQGQLIDVLSLAGQFVSGRNIRVPVGFEGAAAFDQDVQVALNSIPGALDIINGSGDRTIGFKTGGTLVTEFRAALGSKFGPSRTGLPLSANEDEFVARVQLDDTGANKFNFLFDNQLAEDKDAIEGVKAAYKAYGIQTEPTTDIAKLIAKKAFGTAIVTAETVTIQDSSTMRAKINAL